jgi:hypothetical protein
MSSEKVFSSNCGQILFSLRAETVHDCAFLEKHLDIRALLTASIADWRE